MHSTSDIPFNRNSKYTVKHRAAYQYDNNRNIASIAPDHDVNTSIIWGYGNTLPVAKVVNSGSSGIAYCGFEDRTTLGNWNLSSANYNYITTSAAKGNSSILWNSGTISGPILNISVKYRLRFYAKSSSSGSVSIQGAGTISIIGDNTWHLYESTIQSLTSLVLSANSSLYLDEINICPQAARMTTYIYDPLIGIRSSTDPNEVTTYYEYDSFNRLYRIRDKDRNILKQFDYHYKQ